MLERLCNPARSKLRDFSNDPEPAPVRACSEIHIEKGESTNRWIKIYNKWFASSD
jgi:hypothetical protein